MNNRLRTYGEVAKRAKNRKHKTKNETVVCKGVSYEINVKGSGVYREIIKRTIEQLHAGLETHGRLMVVRFDLHSKAFQADNEEIRAFRKRIMVWVERTYETHAIGFVWAREQEAAKHQHYHFALWIDERKIRHPSKLLAHIMAKWEESDPSNHHMPHIKNPYYVVSDIEGLAAVVYRLSYLAKVRGKGYRPEQVKDYSTSRLKVA